MDKTALIGCYKVAKMFGFIDGKMALYTPEEILADVKNQIAAGDSEPAELAEYERNLGTIYEFCEDGRMLGWMKIPEGTPQDAIDAALAAGQLLGVKDGLFCREAKAWKEENGECFYDTEQKREVLGEALTSWDKLELNEDGLLPFASGTLLLEKL